MQPRCILVTGASGFVGVHLMPVLQGAFPDSRIVGMANAAHDHIAQIDITDAEAVREFVAEIQPDACIHLAAVAAIGIARDDPDHTWRVNLYGTLALARALLEMAPHCILLFISSSD